MPGWRALGAVWAVLLMLAAGGAIGLQALGPPASPTEHRPDPEPASHAPPPPPAPPPAAPVARTGVAPPDPALLERSAAFPTMQLPRIGADGRTARDVYAAPVPTVPAGRPRVALLVAGFGQSEKDSRTALEALPGPVSFAVSAYAGAPGSLFDAARAGGHELLASIPMEPQGFPLSDAGSKSLLTGLSPADNKQNLEWALGRTPGAVGATGASDGMRGERFAELSGAFDPVLDEIARRGLLYIDPRPGRTPHRPNLADRAVDVVLDETPARAEIEARLAALERTARDKGTAVGLVTSIKPVTLDRLSAWVKSLHDKGIALVPVSSLVPVPGTFSETK